MVYKIWRRESNYYMVHVAMGDEEKLLGDSALRTLADVKC